MAIPHVSPAGSVARVVLGLDDLAQALRALQPPAAYRLSVASGIEYRNVRRALEQPHATRLDTWRRIVHILEACVVAARSAEDILRPEAQARIVALSPGAEALVEPGRALALRDYRRARGWSRRALARRAGTCTEAVAAVERGLGLVRSVRRVCGGMDLQLLVALPPGHASLDALWLERAPWCLERVCERGMSRTKPLLSEC